MQASSRSLDKGKQKARDTEALTESEPFRSDPQEVDAESSKAQAPMDIPCQATSSRFSQAADSHLTQTPSSPQDHGRRPTHTRAKSSLGSSNMFDFFGPSSLASNSTVASSFQFGSPGESLKRDVESTAARATELVNFEQRGCLEDTIDASGFRAASEDPVFNATAEGHSDAIDVASDPAEVSLTSELAASGQLGSATAPMPPLYPEESLPGYEEAPEYTPPLSHSAAGNSRSKTSAFRTAAANRFLSSRIAKKLNLPPTLQSRLQGTQTPDAPSTSQRTLSATERIDGRLRFARSDSAPNLTQTHVRRRIEVHNYAATAYVDGARMGPAPRHPRPTPSRPSTADAHTARSNASVAPAARPSTSTGMATAARAQHSASPMLRTAVSSASSSRRNSGDSRPPSRATISSAPNGGLFTCGYSSGRSGATTPTRPSLLRKGRSRNVSLRSLGDIFSINRERDRLRQDGSSHSAQQEGEEQQQKSEEAHPGTVLREVVSPVSPELLISARVHPSLATRPTLMNAAHSSAQAGVDAIGSGSPVLILPHRSQERKPDPLQRLPREVILSIFKSLVDLHIQEHDKAVKDGFWKGRKAIDTRWVGAEAAIRELARLSRVSRTWQSYVLDGQLWQKLEFSKYPDMTEEAMINIAKAVGPFVRCLDLHGLAGLRSSVLVALSKAQRAPSLTRCDPSTSACLSVATCQLEELDLRGCRQISTSALNTVLSHSPNLKRCKLANLPCVDNTTLCILAATAVNLEYLDISRCRNVDGEGIRAIFAIQEIETNVSAVSKERNVGSKFRELYASGLSGFDSDTLAHFGRHWPNLEVLDLSYCSDVNDAAIAALVSSDRDVVSEKGNFVTLTSRQAGSHQDDEVVRRSFPYLRKLILSSCRALTDRACVSLSHAVPKLEVLELANIGPALKDTGLVKLFATTPQLQKLDLERASQITDAVLSALTPPESHAEAFGLAVPDRDTLMNSVRPRGSLLNRARRSASRRRQAGQSTTATQGDVPPSYDEESVAALIPATGTHLTHLILSSANQLSAEALLLLINRCPFLVHLEVDDTHADNEVATQFVQLARYRKVQNAYLSLIDCRSFSRDTYSHMNRGDATDSGIRPRRGSRGYAFRHFSYDDPEPSLAMTAATTILAGGGSQSRGEQDPHISESGVRTSIDGRDRDRDRGHDECNELKPIVKSFWGWQMVDARLKQKRKAEQRAAAHKKQGGRSKVTSVVAMALGIPVASEDGPAAAYSTTRGVGGGGPRWSRMLTGTEGAGPGQRRAGGDAVDHDDDEDDARGCSVM